MVAREEIARELKANSGWVVLIGVLMTLFGVLSICSPLVTGVAVAYLVGGIVLVSGLVYAFHAFRATSWGSGLMSFLIGVLGVVCGVLMILHPLAGLSFMTMLLIIYFAVDGIASIMMALQMRGQAGTGWTLFGGVVSVILAVLIWRQWPLSGAWAIGVLIGIKFLLTGWSLIAMGWAARAIAGAAAETPPDAGEPSSA